MGQTASTSTTTDNEGNFVFPQLSPATYVLTVEAKGFKLDVEGNLYCTGPGGVWIVSPAGRHLGTVITPEVPANCHWGDADGKTLYITARTSLYRIRLKIASIRPITSSANEARANSSDQ